MFFVLFHFNIRKSFAPPKKMGRYFKGFRGLKFATNDVIGKKYGFRSGTIIAIGIGISIVSDPDSTLTNNLSYLKLKGGHTDHKFKVFNLLYHFKRYRRFGS